MTPRIEEGLRPGCIGRIAQLHGKYYAATHGFGVEFEAKVARELGDFCMSYTPARDGLWLALGPDTDPASGAAPSPNSEVDIQGSIAIDGTHAQTQGAHLRWFITSNTWRGQHLGRALLGRALAFVDACDYPRTTLWTFSGLHAARHLYESHGFKLVHESPGQQWGTQVLEQQFERLRGSGQPRYACRSGPTGCQP